MLKLNVFNLINTFFIVSIYSKAFLFLTFNILFLNLMFCNFEQNIPSTSTKNFLSHGQILLTTMRYSFKSNFALTRIKDREKNKWDVISYSEVHIIIVRSKFYINRTYGVAWFFFRNVCLSIITHEFCWLIFCLLFNEKLNLTWEWEIAFSLYS